MKKFSFVMLALIFILSLAAGCTPAATETATEAVVATEAVAQPSAVPPTAVPPTTAPTAVPPTEAAPAKDSLVIGISAGPDNYWNSMDSQTPISGLVNNVVYEGMMDWDTTFSEMQPRLATSYEVSEDGTIITYHLRDDVTFHNGDQFTSADVAATFNEAKNNAWAMSVWDYLDRIETPDETTVVFYLTQRVMTYPWTLAQMKILPASVLASEGVTSLDRTPIGTGPYKFVSYDEGVSVSLAVNDSYWGTIPPIKNIRIDIIPDENTLATALQNGDVDFTDVKAVMIPTLKELPGITIAHGPSVRLSYVQLNTEKLPLAVRKAIAYAADRAYMLEVASNGAGTMYSTVTFNHNVFGFDDTGAIDYSYDLDKAAQALADGGIQTPLDLGLLRGYTSARVSKEAEILQADLASIGLNVQIEISDYGAFSDSVLAGDYAIAIQGASYGDTLTGYANIFESKFIGSTNYALYNNPAMDTLFEEAIAAPDLETYIAKSKQIIELAQEDVPYVMLYEMDVLDAHNSNLNVVIGLENNNFLNLFSWK
jgi:peptide/nickel transport system substrate-binding protein